MHICWLAKVIRSRLQCCPAWYPHANPACFPLLSGFAARTRKLCGGFIHPLLHWHWFSFTRALLFLCWEQRHVGFCVCISASALPVNVYLKSGSKTCFPVAFLPSCSTRTFRTAVSLVNIPCFFNFHLSVFKQKAAGKLLGHVQLVDMSLQVYLFFGCRGLRSLQGFFFLRRDSRGLEQISTGSDCRAFIQSRAKAIFDGQARPSVGSRW